MLLSRNNSELFLIYSLFINMHFISTVRGNRTHEVDADSKLSTHRF